MYRIAWSDCATDVRSDDPGLITQIGHYLDLPLVPIESSETGDAKVLLAAEVARSGDGYRIRCPFGNFAMLTPADTLFMLLEAVAYRFASSTRRLVVHAGGFINGGGAVIYFGAGWSGKSSLTFAAWRHGVEVLGDDRVCLDPASGCAAIFPKCLKLRLDANDPPEALAGAVSASDAFAGSLAGDRRAVVSRRVPGFVDYEATPPIRALVQIERTDDGESRLEEVPVVDTLDEILAQTALGGSTPMEMVRLVKTHASGGRLPRLRIAKDDTETAFALLRAL